MAIKEDSLRDTHINKKLPSNQNFYSVCRQNLRLNLIFKVSKNWNQSDISLTMKISVTRQQLFTN